jgi:malonyl-CoA decarboxylase
MRRSSMRSGQARRSSTRSPTPRRPARRLVRQFPAQAGGRRSQARLPAAGQLCHPVAAALFRRWAEKNPEAWQQAFSEADLERIRRHLPPDTPPPASASDLARLLADDRWADDDRLARALQHGLTAPGRALPADHRQGRTALRPGCPLSISATARASNASTIWPTPRPRGRQQSYGLMVNYLYDPDTIEANVEAFSRSGEIAAAAAIRRSARD